MVVVDADGPSSVMIRNNFQEILLIPVHAVTRGTHKSIINDFSVGT